MQFFNVVAFVALFAMVSAAPVVVDAEKRGEDTTAYAPAYFYYVVDGIDGPYT